MNAGFIGPGSGRGRDACAALVALAARTADTERDVRRFIRRLGEAGAGVRPGLTGLVDLARAGSNPLPGQGFRRELDDGTDGQVRHFCGLAAACERFGGRLTWWLSVHVRRDAPDTPDGRLTDHAIAFVEALQRGELAIDDAADWLRGTLCARTSGPADAADEPADTPVTDGSPARPHA